MVSQKSDMQYEGSKPEVNRVPVLGMKAARVSLSESLQFLYDRRENKTEFPA